MTNKVLMEDLAHTWEMLSKKEREKLSNSTVLLTGCGGFLGQYYLSFFERYADQLNLKKVIGVDSLLLGKSPLLTGLEKHPLFDIRYIDVSLLSGTDVFKQYSIDYIIHLASIASPTYYRKYPIETVDSNIWGLRVLLDAFSDKPLKGFLFYSSSEVYGDPHNDYVPSSEEYLGNVPCIGPRACYDESKRFGETLCYIYANKFEMPIRIVRLFNIYGPGLKINDRRVPADFANSIIKNEDIVILSNGQHTRTFCYVADSIAGEIKALLYSQFDVFNIGLDANENTVLEFAEMFQKAGENVVNYNGKIIYDVSDDIHYLTHDPVRRCPDISKAKTLLSYNPSICLQEGLERYIRYLIDEGENATW